MDGIGEAHLLEADSPEAIDKDKENADSPFACLLFDALDSLPTDSNLLDIPDPPKQTEVSFFTVAVPLEEHDANTDPAALIAGDKGADGRKRKRKRSDVTITLASSIKKTRAGSFSRPEPSRQKAVTPPPLVDLATLHSIANSSAQKSTPPFPASTATVPVLEVPERIDIVNEWNAPFRSENSDLTIISSDGLRFKVHQALLGSASAKFYHIIMSCQLVNPGQVPSLTCFHPVFGTGQIISLVLRVLYQLQFPLITFFNYRSFGQAVLFMRQHGCTEAETVLRNRLRRIPMDPSLGLSPLLVFLTGAIMTDVEMCTNAIKHGRGWMFGTKVPNDDQQGQSSNEGDAAVGHVVREVDLLDTSRTVDGYSVLDPRGWSAAVMSEVPPNYVGLMLRLTLKYGFRPDMATWEEAAEDFGKCLLASE